MDNITTALTAVFYKAIFVLKLMGTKKGLAITIPVMTIVSVSVRADYAVVFLLLLMAVDFATGIGASIELKKKYEKAHPNEEKKSLISSDKLKKSGVKFLLYGLTVLVAYGIEVIFLIKQFNFSWSDAQFSLPVIVIAFWSIVEIYSIVFENLKEMGMDVKAIVLKIWKNYKSTKKEFSDE